MTPVLVRVSTASGASRRPKIFARTLVITGDRDWACGPDLARSMTALLPRAELAVISGAGHFAWVERPAEYASRVAAFLAGSPDLGP